MLKFLTRAPPADALKSDKFSQALRELGKRELSFDATVLHFQLPDLAEVAAKHPETTIILDHLGLAAADHATPASRKEAFDAWKSNMIVAALSPNIYCKISGLGTSYWKFPFYLAAEPVGYRELAEVWRPYIETAVETFGPHRCMVASNFPNDGRTCGFVPLWNAYKHVCRQYSDAERDAIFFGTAKAVYRLH